MGPALSAVKIGVLAAIVVLMVTLTALIAVPISHPFSAQIVVETYSVASINLTFPSGSRVSGDWWTPNGSEVDFVITGPSGTTVYEADSVSSGHFGFTAGNGRYEFSAGFPTSAGVALAADATPVQIDGHYSSPIL